ncbi:DUF1330 domain-containing protein [Porticoccaceae bacterium]|nr:DUF1330 domain-containing protein [Porticoccaceae bacterium]
MKNPVYLIVSSKVHDDEKLKLYQKEAIPLAEKAGMEVLSVTESPEVLEGEWPHKGILVIEKFDSMEDLKAYRNSDAYLAARKHVEGPGVADLDFVIAVEALSEE